MQPEVMANTLKPGKLGVSLDYKLRRNDCYTTTKHVLDRLKQRNLSMDDLRHAVAHPRKVEPYADLPQNGGTCWRLFGRDVDSETEVGVGFEAYLDKRGRWADPLHDLCR